MQNTDYLAILQRTCLLPVQSITVQLLSEEVLIVLKVLPKLWKHLNHRILSQNKLARGFWNARNDFLDPVSNFVMESAGRSARRPNFNSDEIGVLVEEVERRKNVLLGKLSPSVTLKTKSLAWDAVAEAINCVSSARYLVGKSKRNSWTSNQMRRQKEPYLPKSYRRLAVDHQLPPSPIYIIG